MCVLYIHIVIEYCIFVSLFGCSLVCVCVCTAQDRLLSLKLHSVKVGTPPLGHEYILVPELQ